MRTEISYKWQKQLLNFELDADQRLQQARWSSRQQVLQNGPGTERKGEQS